MAMRCVSCHAPIRDLDRPTLHKKQGWFTIGQMTLLTNRLRCPVCIRIMEAEMWARDQLSKERKR